MLAKYFEGQNVKKRMTWKSLSWAAKVCDRLQILSNEIVNNVKWMDLELKSFQWFANPTAKVAAMTIESYLYLRTHKLPLRPVLAGTAPV